MLGHTKRGQLPPQCKELRWCLSSKKTFNCLDFIAGIVLRQILNRYYSSEKKKKDICWNYKPILLSNMWLDIICSGLTFKTSKRSGKRTPDKHCCPRQSGEVSSLKAKYVPVIYQSSIQHPAGTNSSHWHPWELPSLKLSPPSEVAWRGWEAASSGLGFQDFLGAPLTGKVSPGSGAANGCISLVIPRILQYLY